MGNRKLRHLLLAAVLAGALAATSACEVGVDVDIDVEENGSGTVAVGVSLDRAAVDTLGDLVSQIDLQDLALAGWDVTGPERETDNLLWVRATKRFGTAEELPEVLAEIAGEDVFQGFQLRRRAEFAEQTWEIFGQVDPSEALPDLFDTLALNEGLQERIRGAIGDFGGDLPLEGLTIGLNIDLPGQLTSGGGNFGWSSISTQSPTGQATVQMTARQENTTAMTLRLVGLAAAALFVLALILNLLGWWYVRRHRKERERALLEKADSQPMPIVVGEPGDVEQGSAVSNAASEAGWKEFGEFEELDEVTFEPTPAGIETSEDDWTASLEGSAKAEIESFVAAKPTTTPALEEPEGSEPKQAELGEPLVEPGGPAAKREAEPEEAALSEPEADELVSSKVEIDEPETAPANPEAEPKPQDTEDGMTLEPDMTEPETAKPDEPNPSEPEPGTPADSEPEASTSSAAADPPSRALQLVVIGGWGVLFQPADPAGELLIPFVQQAGATASPAEILESYRLATLGRLTPVQLWEACGLSGQPTWTHGPYTGRMSVSPGAADFVRALLRRGISVGCITNDVSDWSLRLRAWTGFEEISPWVVSSDIGIRKPDPGFFEMLRRVSEVPFANCLVIDNDVRTLDAARSLGMSTGLFVASAEDPSSEVQSTHPVVGDFKSLLRRT